MMIKVTGPAGQCCMNFLDYSVEVLDGKAVIQVHGPVINDSPSLTYRRFDYPEFNRVFIMDQSGDTKDSFCLQHWDPEWLKQEKLKQLQQEQAEMEKLAAKIQRPNE